MGLFFAVYGDVTRVIKGEWVPRVKYDLEKLQAELAYISFSVTQNEQTEYAGQSKYSETEDKGIYNCIVCKENLFNSDLKYQTDFGWPAFYEPSGNVVLMEKKNQIKYEMHMDRTQVKCENCGAHLGYVFPDGPEDKTGERYSINSAALEFERNLE